LPLTFILCYIFYKLRLSVNQIQKIKNTAIRVFGIGTKVFLFGSRIDDQKKGGDIDLYIKPVQDFDEKTVFEYKIRFLSQVKKLIGDRKIDVIVKHRYSNYNFIEDIQQTSLLL